MKHKFEDDSDCVRCGAYGPNDEDTPCEPVKACEEHGRCWTHSEWADLEGKEVPGIVDQTTGDWEPMVSLTMSEHQDMVFAINDVLQIAQELDRQIQCIRDSRAPVKGMHVPYMGPFASAAPSVLKDLERLSSSLKSATGYGDK